MNEVHGPYEPADSGIYRDRCSAKWRSSADSGVPITVTQPDDLAYRLLLDGYTTEPVVYRRGCYICEDPEFAQMGLPLCRTCGHCAGHIAADDTRCDDCGLDGRDDGLPGA